MFDSAVAGVDNKAGTRMAYKITHHTADQRLTFPNRQAAERYADHNGGGRENWTVAVVQRSRATVERRAKR
jgi:hypothetical protein